MKFVIFSILLIFKFINNNANLKFMLCFMILKSLAVVSQNYFNNYY